MEGTVNTVVGGVLYFGLAGEARTIEVFDFEGGSKGQRFCRTESEPEGAWRCEMGPLFGTFLVEVEVERSAPLSAIVSDVQAGEVRENVEVTPIPHLVLAYTEYLLSRSVPFVQAIQKARRLVHEHFAGIDASRVRAENVFDTRAATLAENVVLGVLLVGFDELAGQLADESGILRNSTIDRFTLLSALSADVRADGVFDGVGPMGALRLGSVPLDGSTLRAEYARAILAWLEGPENETAFSRSDFSAVAQAIAENRSEIFSDGTVEPLDDVGPAIGQVVLRKAGREIVGTEPVSGTVTVDVVAEDPSGVLSLEVEVEGEPVGVGENESMAEGVGRFTLDTRAFGSDGPRVLSVVATDRAGAVTKVERAFVSDNTPPVLSAEAAGVVRTGQVRVSGRVSDAIGPVVRIEITGAAAPALVQSPAATFEAMVDVACNQGIELSVSAVDAAENLATVVVPVRCDDTPPSLTWASRTFDQEGTLRATYAPDGSSVSYAFAGTPNRLVFDGSTVWPVTIEKYMNRLDETAENLPTFAFVATDGGFPVTVEYRYLKNGEVVRDFSPLSLGGGSGMEAELVLSYQTLDARLAEGVEADTHRVEVVAKDAAGNETSTFAEFHLRLLSPPVWFGNCQLPSSLSNYSLPGRTLREVYQTRPETLVLQAEVRYVLGTNQSSLAPSGRAIVQFRPGPVVSRITEISEDRHDGPVFVPNDYWAEMCAPPAHRWINAQGQLGPCQAGMIPAEHVTRTYAVDGPFDDEVAHSIGIGMTRGGSPVLPSPNGEFKVAPEVSHVMGVEVQQPQVLIDGAAYGWGESFTVPSGYSASSVPGRYRMPAYDRGPGINFDGDVLNIDARRFVTRGYISGFQIEVAPVVLTARHETLTELSVGVEVAPSCAAALRYTTQL